MNISLRLIILLIASLAIIDILIIIGAVYLKTRSIRLFKKKARLRKKIALELSGESPTFANVQKNERELYVMLWAEISKNIQLPDYLREKLAGKIYEWKMDRNLSKKVLRGSYAKKTAVLSVIEFLEIKRREEFIQLILNNEKDLLLKLKALHMLVSFGLKGSMDIIAESVINGPELYKKKAIRLISQNANDLEAWAFGHLDTKQPDIIRIIISVANRSKNMKFFDFLLKTLESEFEVIRTEAMEVLSNNYKTAVDSSSIFLSKYPEIRKEAAGLVIMREGLPEREKLRTFFENEEIRERVIQALRSKLESDPIMTQEIFGRYIRAESESERLGYTASLYSKADYFILKLLSKNSDNIASLILDFISLGLSSNIINFLNKNKNPEYENALFKIVSQALNTNADFLRQCQLYLEKDIKTRWKISNFAKGEDEKKKRLTRKDKRLMAYMMIFILSVPVISFLALNSAKFKYMFFHETIVSFLFHYHYIFAIYTIAVNTVYLILMTLSWRAINSRQKAWALADRSFLFTSGILPSISILAPAHNEEKTIIQNIRSILSLEYPEMELIVINDGSTDKTAEKIIDNFNLELANPKILSNLRTAPILGFYRNKNIPNFVFIDKRQSGKADALNAGINIASKEYLCSIDADSLLEPESLLKIMFRTLVNEKETVAIGGNIIPVNGSKVDNGHITEIHFPSGKYARFQTIEYLRSFIAGRLGWAKINSLLIISGAFGVFNKKRLLEIGGYLTGKDTRGKDTVGEDMELIVRLVRNMREKKIKHKIEYAHNANCWTEAPEDLSDLIKQRDRWQRGLIEIMIFHKKMLFNKKYGSAGLLGFPYYFIFELLGPFLEGLGYFTLFFSIIWGLIGLSSFLFMFTLVIFLGILISTMALFLSEKEVLYFKGKEFFLCLKTSFLENFGYRQLISVFRMISYVTYLFRNKGWDKIKRYGFDLNNERKGNSVQVDLE